MAAAGRPDAAAQAAATRVEQTMQRLKLWAVPAPVLKPYRQAFGMDTMPFEHWLQLVLVPRLREVARGEAPMPPSSKLAAHATREFDGFDQMKPLIDALHDVDALSSGIEPAESQRSGMPGYWGLRALAHLGVIAGVAIALYVNQQVSSSFIHHFTARTSAVFFGSVRPDTGHSVLRLALMLDRDAQGVVKPTEAHVMLDKSGMQRLAPGERAKVTAPMAFDPATPPQASAIRDWLVASGVAADSSTAMPASVEVLEVLTVARSAATRAELETLRPRLPAGTPEPQIVDIDAHTPEWIGMSAGLGTAVLCCVPFLIFAWRMRRRRLGR